MVEFGNLHKKLKMEDQPVHFRDSFLFYFRKGKNARQACEKLPNVYGHKALKEQWGTIFRAGHFDHKYTRRSSTLTEVDEPEAEA